MVDRNFPYHLVNVFISSEMARYYVLFPLYHIFSLRGGSVRKLLTQLL